MQRLARAAGGAVLRGGSRAARPWPRAPPPPAAGAPRAAPLARPPAAQRRRRWRQQRRGQWDSCRAPSGEDEQREEARDRELVLTWLQIGIMALALPPAGWLYWWYITPEQKKKPKYLVKQEKPQGKANVGGPFTLVDTSGTPRTQADFFGSWPVLYFGFVHCPEICPVELNRMTKVVDRLQKRFPGERFTPVFVSCDPLRDTCAEVETYLSDFHKDFIGLTGTPQQVADVCKTFRIYFSAPTGKEEQEGDYLVDHSIAMYFFDPDFEFIDVFGGRFEVHEIEERMVENITTHIARRRAQRAA
eukprot:TRINITY_DN30284_c0_g1_i1.p2 TRINITY_DN30284_c0_g1~~TRINITY_DN30284_c0_g1_i1.p2  ORF type:complete len:326 (+),score=146.16 TRINITY_DN30284_c0_g1_i1:72-980(+)